ncbi:exodeoxyribonuclease III [Algiphilus sp.]|uniref:exodeoxyribonuclease III n=1 Tax=Algiphilus sp. TaxID=1872431 RepID=UPI0025C00C5C|nr:exodeoxyribonuclease III [Algiphilus sp.]MCK5769161.1 exodeoxyribonuclease III [Algiphilus sp.]
MRIVTLNCNGLRASARKGFFEWLPDSGADVVCLQETRITREQFDARPEFAPDGWHIALKPASKAGYSGVGLYMRQEPDSVIDALGDATFDDEGRYLEARYGNLSVVSLYLPSGTSGTERQDEKYRILDWFATILRQWKDAGREYIVCGDVNIAHREIDLKNWRGNRKNSGFLPEERAWLDGVFGDLGWVDAFRSLHPDAEGEAYTWWSQRGRARENNVGWRIDYQICTPGIAAQLQAMHVHTADNLSDHAPLVADYDHPLRSGA